MRGEQSLSQGKISCQRYKYICIWGDFLDLFTLNIYSIFLVQEIFERYSREIEYIFDFSSSREIRERFGKDPGEIEYIFDFSSLGEIRERFGKDLGKI